jgi:hypothetical protein
MGELDAEGAQVLESQRQVVAVDPIPRAPIARPVLRMEGVKVLEDVDAATPDVAQHRHQAVRLVFRPVTAVLDDQIVGAGEAGQQTCQRRPAPLIHRRVGDSR